MGRWEGLGSNGSYHYLETKQHFLHGQKKQLVEAPKNMHAKLSTAQNLQFSSSAWNHCLFSLQIMPYTYIHNSWPICWVDTMAATLVYENKHARENGYLNYAKERRNFIFKFEMATCQLIPQFYYPKWNFVAYF